MSARDPGARNQKGVVVLRPSYVAFVPTEACTHVAAIAAKAAFATQKNPTFQRLVAHWPAAR